MNNRIDTMKVTIEVGTDPDELCDAVGYLQARLIGDIPPVINDLLLSVLNAQPPRKLLGRLLEREPSPTEVMARSILHRPRRDAEYTAWLDAKAAQFARAEQWAIPELEERARGHFATEDDYRAWLMDRGRRNGDVDELFRWLLRTAHRSNGCFADCAQHAVATPAAVQRLRGLFESDEDFAAFVDAWRVDLIVEFAKEDA